MLPITIPGVGSGIAVKHRPAFDWFLNRFALLPWVIPAGDLAPGVPPCDMAPRQLERFLLEEADYAQRDQIWTAVIQRARQPTTAETYRLLALGLAARGLRGFRNRLAIRDPHELADVDHDLIVGFLRRLDTIRLDVAKIGIKLIDSGITYARTQLHHHRDRSSDVTVGAMYAPVRPPTGDVDTAFRILTAEIAERGYALSEDDIALLAMTALDGHTIIEAAKELGVSLEAAYKRHQRAAKRIREHLSRRDLAE